MNEVYKCEQKLVQEMPHTNKLIHQLETAVLSAAALLQDMGCVLLVVSVQLGGHHIYRFIESGKYFGVMHNGNAFPRSDGLYRLFTAEDIELCAQDKVQGNLCMS